jgi:hypothetical protein
MTRVEQPPGKRGSLKWIQQAVNLNPAILDDLILPGLFGATAIFWRSPLVDDQYAKYRDFDFLERIGAAQLASELEKFWPGHGPQWDGLAQCDDENILLIEAKTHIGELCTPLASAVSREIQAALDETVLFVGAEPQASWSSVFYQLTNRLAHLYFLRRHGLKARLVLINFIGDSERNGPSCEAEWRAAYQVVWHVLGIPKHHKLSPYIVQIFPDVRPDAWNI